MNRSFKTMAILAGLGSAVASTAKADPYTLGNLANFQVYAFDANTTIQLAANANVKGNIGIGTGADILLAGNPVTVTGQIFFADATVTNGGNMSVNAGSYTIDGQAACTTFATCNVAPREVTSSAAASGGKADAVTMYANASALAVTDATLTGNWASSYTWNGNGGTNVADLTSLNLDTGDILTLNGTASDFFIINIENGFTGHHTGKVVLGANVSPDHVLFNMLCATAHSGVCTDDGGSGSVNFTESFTGAGIVLAPDKDITEDITAGWTGRLIGGEAKLIKISSPLNNQGLVPEPSTLPLIASGMMGLATMAVQKRRKGRRA